MFYNLGDYTWLSQFQTNFDQIILELENTLNKPLIDLHKSTWAGERSDYLTSPTDKNTAWKTYTFKFFNIKHLPNYESCPILAQLIDSCPEIVTAEFSLLEPGTHILPHRGFTNLVLRSHLGLIIPEGDIGIRVGKETKKWKTRNFLIFDDSIDHEAWNKTHEKRIVLMIDFIPNNSLFSVKEVATKIMKKTNDKHILNIAPRETWLDWINTGVFPTKAER